MVHFLAKFAIFWPKIKFLTKMRFFLPKMPILKKFNFLAKNAVFDKNSIFLAKNDSRRSKVWLKMENENLTKEWLAKDVN